MVRQIKILFYKLFEFHRRLEIKTVHWDEADKLFRSNRGKPESEQWIIAPEDVETDYPFVTLERRERVTE